MVTWSEFCDVSMSLMRSSEKLSHRNLRHKLFNTCAKFHNSTTKDSHIVKGGEILPLPGS